MASQTTTAPFASFELQPSSTQGTISNTAAASTSTGVDSSASDTLSFIGSAPSTVLFFVALAVGVFIALVFVFFTIRYFIRSKYGIAASPFGRRGPYVPSTFGNASGGANSHAFIHEFTREEIQEQLRFMRDHNQTRANIIEETLAFSEGRFRRGRRRHDRRRRRRRRFSKMKKLTAEEVEKLFPEKTYHDWLNGGKERDVAKRDGVLKEEVELEAVEALDKSVEETSVSSMHTAQEQHPDGIELTKVATNGDITTEDPKTCCRTEASSHIDPQFDSGSCAICIEELEDDDLVRGLICGHVFHAACLDPWLTTRRACCPLCKRDYLFKRDYQPENETHEPASGESGGRNDNTNAGTDLATVENGRTESDDDDDDDDGIESLDFEEIQRDPTLQAFLQDLIPTSERARLVLLDPQYAGISLEERAKQMAKKKYGRFFKVIVWKVLGIKRSDLFYWAVLTIASEHRRARQLEELQSSGSANVGTTTADGRLNQNNQVANDQHQLAEDTSSTSNHAYATAGQTEIDVAEATRRREVVDNRV
ncbi:hypothetical protein KGF57_000978 [Candida theae]|uniref:RING-type domain-containing protein n=1 Tax=Candida theae TaxID=1198502 RepID=A0AAD5BHX3_9ASCO|nr:uncharacterized protein KGF57_000978 [Candida theae]KAI5964486.1 hypothetical protein KGF57_000978 [Candida theae]